MVLIWWCCVFPGVRDLRRRLLKAAAGPHTAPLHLLRPLCLLGMPESLLPSAGAHRPPGQLRAPAGLRGLPSPLGRYSDMTADRGVAIEEGVAGPEWGPKVSYSVLTDLDPDPV